MPLAEEGDERGAKQNAAAIRARFMPSPRVRAQPRASA
jgi:hypothetical protein